MLNDQLREFAVLRHDPGPGVSRTTQPHLDWMFQLDDRLHTFATDLTDAFYSKQVIVLEAIELPPHRLDYLTIRGDLDRGLGRLTEAASGGYDLIEQQKDSFLAAIYGQHNRGGFHATCRFCCIRSQKSGMSDRVRWHLELTANC